MENQALTILVYVLAIWFSITSVILVVIAYRVLKIISSFHLLVRNVNNSIVSFNALKAGIAYQVTSKVIDVLKLFKKK